MEDKQVQLTVISSEKSLVHLMTLIRQFDEALPTLEIIKLAKVCVSIYGALCISLYTMYGDCLITMHKLILLCTV